MKRSFCSRCGFPSVFRVLILIAMIGFSQGWVVAQDQPAPGKDASQDAIHVASDRLFSDNNARFVEFIGNVRATQGANVITADRLKVYYKSDLASAESKGAGEESIHKIVSSGNVVIEFDNRVAKADNAVYITESRILILTGPNSSITSGKNTVTGEKITFYREDARIQVESGKQGRVGAVFYQEGKGLN